MSTNVNIEVGFMKVTWRRISSVFLVRFKVQLDRNHWELKLTFGLE